MLVEGLACVFHGERVAGVLAWARGARVRVVGTPPRAPALDSRHIWKAGRVAAGGCFGNGFIAGLAQFSYKSKNLFADRKQPPLMLAEPPLTIDADYATNDQAGALDGMGTRAVLVAVSDCVFHGERVAGALAWALGARVRVVGGTLRQAQGERGWGAGLRRGCGEGGCEGGWWWGCPARRPWIPAFAGKTRVGTTLRRAQGERPAPQRTPEQDVAQALKHSRRRVTLWGQESPAQSAFAATINRESRRASTSISNNGSSWRIDA